MRVKICYPFTINPLSKTFDTDASTFKQLRIRWFYFKLRFKHLFAREGLSVYFYLQNSKHNKQEMNSPTSKESLQLIGLDVRLLEVLSYQQKLQASPQN